MFKNRSTEKELLDDVTHNHKDLIRNLHEIEFTNRWFGSSHTFISSLDRIHKKNPEYFKNRTIDIVDLGCGGGDLLRLAQAWTRTKKINANLLGLDVNPYIVQQAQSLSTHFPSIEYQQLDIFSDDFKKLHFDIVTLNSVCHHMTDEELINLLQQLQTQTKVAIVINDLQRHWLPYLGIKLVSKLLNFSSYGQQDGPISVLRGFQKKDLLQIMHNAKNYDLRWTWAFRWQVIIWCEPFKNIKGRLN